jgi:hypothetical protein
MQASILKKLWTCHFWNFERSVVHKSAGRCNDICFAFFYLFNFNFQNLGELRVELHKPPLKMKELWKVRDGLAKPEIQPIIPGVICFVLLQVESFGVVQCVREILSVWLLCLRDLPHTYSCTCLLDKETKGKQTRALPVWTPGSLDFIIIFIIIINTIIILLLLKVF